jgi:hypothetical protein
MGAGARPPLLSLALVDENHILISDQQISIFCGLGQWEGSKLRADRDDSARHGRQTLILSTGEDSFLM